MFSIVSCRIIFVVVLLVLCTFYHSIGLKYEGWGFGVVPIGLRWRVIMECFLIMDGSLFVNSTGGLGVFSWVIFLLFMGVGLFVFSSFTKRCFGGFCFSRGLVGGFLLSVRGWYGVGY